MGSGLLYGKARNQKVGDQFSSGHVTSEGGKRKCDTDSQL